MKQSFKDRLKILMKDDKPYTWARKVGIEKGLFQYYWQKGKIPTYENLLKIQRATGCSLDWLLTGKAVAVDQIDNLPFVKESKPLYGAQNLRRADSLDLVNDVYASKNKSDIKLLERLLSKLVASNKKKKTRSGK